MVYLMAYLYVICRNSVVVHSIGMERTDMVTLIFSLAIACIGLLAVLYLQTERLEMLRQQMDEFCEKLETEAHAREDAWQYLVDDVREPAAKVCELAQLIQDNRNDTERVAQLQAESYEAANKVLQTLQKDMPPRRKLVVNPWKK